MALPRRHPDYLALDIAMKILGGEGGNRLHRVLRSERGLTYGASADLNALKEAGDIVAETDTRSEKTGGGAAIDRRRDRASCSGSACSSASCPTRRSI